MLGRFVSHGVAVASVTASSVRERAAEEPRPLSAVPAGMAFVSGSKSWLGREGGEMKARDDDCAHHCSSAAAYARALPGSRSDVVPVSCGCASPLSAAASISACGLPFGPVFVGATVCRGRPCLCACVWGATRMFVFPPPEKKRPAFVLASRPLVFAVGGGGSGCGRDCPLLLSGKGWEEKRRRAVAVNAPGSWRDLASP